MAEIILLDGGLGQELIRRAGDTPTPLWSTQVMIDHPGIVEEVHKAYFDAGATVATTNTYSLHRDRLEPAGLGQRFNDLCQRALNEARSARSSVATGRVAGSIGPLRASYRPDLHPAHTEAVQSYAELARVLGPGVDLILCETVASLAHAEAVLEGAKHAGKPVWIAFTLDDTDGRRLRSGEPVTDCVAVARRGGAQAILANCSVPEVMHSALEAFSDGGLPFGAYANGFTHIDAAFLGDAPTVDVLTSRQDLSPPAYADFVLKWVEAGATIVGGCCEVGPDHIREVARVLLSRGHTLV